MLSDNRSSFGVDYYHLVSDSKFTKFIQYNKNIWSNLLSFGILCKSLIALCTFFSNSCRINLNFLIFFIIFHKLFYILYQIIYTFHKVKILWSELRKPT